MLEVFSRLTTKKITEVRRKEDDRGLFLLEVNVPGDNEEESIEYTYNREGHGGFVWTNEIYATYYESGMPISGNTVAKYEDGEWKILEI